MTNVVPFDFGTATIRTVLRDGEPWFVGRDVALVLGYTNPSKALSDHCRGANVSLLPSTSGDQNYTIIPERDVYRLIMRSKLPAAERFEEWVVGTVLPSLRKHGGYVVGQEVLTNEQVLANAILVAQSVIAEKDARICAMAPAAAVAEDTFILGRLITLADFTKRLAGVNTNMVKRALTPKYFWRQPGNDTCRVRSEYRDKFFSEKSDERYERHNTTIVVLPEGQKELTRLYRAGELPMKKGCERLWRAAK